MSQPTFSHVASPSALARLPQGTALYYQNGSGQYVHIPTMQAYQQLAPGTAIYTANPQTQTAAPQQTAQQLQNQLSAQGIMDSILNPLGLQSLSQWALSMYAQSGDWSYVSSQLPTTQASQARFPAWAAWSAQGHTAAQYVAYENTIYQEAHRAGFPSGVVNENTITNWINGGVSATEGTQRIQDASAAVHQLDKNAQSYLTTRELGLTDSDLAAAFFDPHTAIPVLENKLKGAQIGGAALNAGIDLNTGLASDLVNAGVSQSQAQTGFGAIANQQQLYQALPGQQGPTLNQAQQVGAQFGTNPSAAQQVKNTAAQRTAVFKQGGGVASTSQGFVGAGVARGA